jgi:hypothetical protein
VAVVTPIKLNNKRSNDGQDRHKGARGNNRQVASGAAIGIGTRTPPLSRSRWAPAMRDGDGGKGKGGGSVLAAMHRNDQTQTPPSTGGKTKAKANTLAAVPAAGRAGLECNNGSGDEKHLGTTRNLANADGWITCSKRGE